jgi:hypothetical protein
LGEYAVGALSWMFRHAPIPLNLLLHMGIRIILRKYNSMFKFFEAAFKPQHVV